MRAYIDLHFSPEGISPLEVGDRLRRLADLSFIVGPHDLVFTWDDVEEFRDRLNRIHAALKGTGVSYRIETVSDELLLGEPVSWPPPLKEEPTPHPAYGHPLGK
ncbi:MAG TPA: hypothetical protein VEY07_07665 [Thermoplasmata archaeon]|nr:hypothetical protein [Thermoplasmata archaeon]